eukprot:scaffold31_cov263-Pinguiococcus_pyrenoidosus.AAC.16
MSSRRAAAAAVPPPTITISAKFCCACSGSALAMLSRLTAIAGAIRRPLRRTRRLLAWVRDLQDVEPRPPGHWDRTDSAAIPAARSKCRWCCRHHHRRHGAPTQLLAPFMGTEAQQVWRRCNACGALRTANGRPRHCAENSRK